MRPPGDRAAGRPSVSIPLDAFAALAAVRDYSRYSGHFLAVRPIPPTVLQAGVSTEERHDGATVEVPETVPGVHVVVAGTPHRAKHVQGYWHIDPRDEIVVTIPAAAPGGTAWRLIVESVRTAAESDRVAWYCRRCDHVLLDVEVAAGVDDIPTFETQIEAVVERFNADVRLRTCERCGGEHPLAYSPLTPPSDEVAAARAAW